MKWCTALLILLLVFSPLEAGAKKMYPLPIRLNNPGALEITDDSWVGMEKFQPHTRFVRFNTPKYGIRAMMKVLRNYEHLYGFNTISSIINRWAPPGENKSNVYIEYVSKSMNTPRNVLIDLDDPLVLISLAKAITMYESGKPPEGLPPNWYPETLFQEAALMLLKENE